MINTFNLSWSISPLHYFLFTSPLTIFILLFLIIYLKLKVNKRIILLNI